MFRKYPFTIILHARPAEARVTHPHRLKLDPGANTTGIAVVAESTGKVVWAGELAHRGQQIRAALQRRRAVRRSRRQRKTRYRAARFRNRRRPAGWLAPSLAHRCVGASTPDHLDARGVQPLRIRATGHGTRQVCRTNAAGVPTRHKPRARTFQGWQTGDLVRAVIPTGKYAGTHVGRIAIRFRPSFRLDGRLDVHPKYLTRLQHADGYHYAVPGASPAA